MESANGVKLSKLLAALPEHVTLFSSRHVPDLSISGLACDSRKVAPGNLFVAISGVDADGHRFVGDAIGRGAIAVVAQKPVASLPSSCEIPILPVADSREAWAWLAAAWHGYPGRELRVIGVTGTDGKTTTVRLIAEILRAAGRRVGWITTVSAFLGSEEADTGLHTTTPDALEVQWYLAQMLAAGLQYAVIEATSHGLAQHRVTGCEFDIGVVTNITHEHLDYHGTFQEYCAAKARLFTRVGSSFHKPGVQKVCVLNADDTSYDFLEQFCTSSSVSFGIERPADVEAFDVQATPSGLSLRLATPEGALAITSPLIGLFNAYNVLAAATVTLSLGIPFSAIQQGIASFGGVVGRMERVNLGQDFTVMIDFAHTPNALAHALRTARTLTEGQVLVVFGCAGLRDRAKRPKMGRIAGELADYVFLTAEDPRTEDVGDILRQIAAGCERAGRREATDYWKIPDRSSAIDTAISKAQPGDLVIVTGKGHEQSMCFGTTEQPWSDHQAVRRALRQRLGIKP